MKRIPSSLFFGMACIVCILCIASSISFVNAFHFFPSTHFYIARTTGAKVPHPLIVFLAKPLNNKISFAQRKKCRSRKQQQQSISFPEKPKKIHGGPRDYINYKPKPIVDGSEQQQQQPEKQQNSSPSQQKQKDASDART